MTSAWVTVVGTLGGAIVGGLVAVAGQWLQWRRDKTTRWDTSRKDAYAQFLATSERTQEALWRIAYSIIDRRSPDQITVRWQEANAYWREVSSQLDLVSLLAAAQPTADAAEAVTRYLKEFKDEVYEGDSERFKTEKDYKNSFSQVRSGFVRAAKKELGIAEALDISK